MGYSAIDLNHISNPRVRSQLLPLIQNCTTYKTKDITVQMKTLLMADVPICLSPRRLQHTEKKIVEVKSQNGLVRELFAGALLISPPE